jgi:hypothetical protein
MELILVELLKNHVTIVYQKFIVGVHLSSRTTICKSYFTFTYNSKK